MKRDYYEVLGVPKDADLQQVKKSYRKLARELHPDANSSDPNSEEKFKEATEAYEVLSDPEKRGIYDTYGHEGLRRGAGGAGGGFDGFPDFGDIFQSFFGNFAGGSPFGAAQPTGPARGQDIGVEIELTLEEAAFGVERELTFEAYNTCPDCEGAGTTDPSSIKACADCGGRGRVRTVRQTILGQFVQTGTCPRCDGSGKVIESPCKRCRGAGRVYSERTVTVNIPAGINEGQRIRASGNGGAGERGARAGDLYVQVNLAPHPQFQRRDDDILHNVNLTLGQAALGTTLDIPTLDGEQEVVFAPGTQPGEVKILRGKGVPHLHGHGRGNEEVLVNVMVPRNLDDQQRALLQEFEESTGAEHYGDDGEHPDGVLRRLRNLFTG